MRNSRTLQTLLFAAIASTPAMAQGGADCATATAISGNGPHMFDQTGAVGTGVTSICGTVNADVWFAWTASQTVDHILSTCAGATHDTKIAVFDSCGGIDLACDDDGCGTLQSELIFSAVSGTTYYFQIGTFGTVPGATGTFTITPDLPVLNPNNGNYYKVVSDWQSAKTEAEATIFNGMPGHLVTFSDAAERDWVLNNLSVTRPWIGLFHNTTASNYMEPDMGWEWVTGEPVSFLSWASGEPNDNAAGGGPEDYAEMFASGDWNDAELFHTITDSYIVEWGGGSTGIAFCNPMNPNTTGASTTLTAQPDSNAGSGFHLEGSQGVPGQFGYILIGTGSADPGISVGSGRLCLSVAAGNLIGRYNQVGGVLNSVGQFDANGVLQNIVGTSASGSGFDIPTAIPIPGGMTIMAGDTWHFQLWHRQAGGDSNFSNGLSIQF